MAKVERFEDLICWQEARKLAREIYAVTKSGDLARDFGLRDQLQRAAVSAMTNIAEGFSRFHRRDFVRFLDIAQSSAAEVKSLLCVVLDQGYLPSESVKQLQSQADVVVKRSKGLLRHVYEQDRRLGGAGEVRDGKVDCGDHVRI